MNKALGLIETIGLVPAIEAADAAVKAANVTLLGYENTKGGGKITVKLAGDVGAVQAAVAAGVAAARRIGKVYSHLVIPRPHQEIDALIRQVDRGPAKETPTLASAPAAPAPAAAAEPSAPVEESPAEEPPAEEAHRCAAITQSGEQCKLSARPGSAYCNIHRKLESPG
jgi:microcompartment protein CcmL/EutN